MQIQRPGKMRDFHTRVRIPDPSFRIEYTTPLFFMGSCFADHIGRNLQEMKFTVCHNPYGVIYNPLSMAKNISLLQEKDSFEETDLAFHNELWFSYSHYTLFSDIRKESCLEKINTQFREAKKILKEASILYITLGTSWYYTLKETGEVVNNCHKLPAGNFNRHFSSVEESTEALFDSFQKLRKINPELKIVLTVSPVRHWKDGAVENQRSKSALILSIASLQSRMKDIFYFPAYEIFMDELRDYRFYASDKLHPSEEAQEYIRERFVETYLSDEAGRTLQNVEKIINSVKHYPRFPETQTYKKFIKNTLQSIHKLTIEHPYLDFSNEIAQLKKV